VAETSYWCHVILTRQTLSTTSPMRRPHWQQASPDFLIACPFHHALES